MRKLLFSFLIVSCLIQKINSQNGYALSLPGGTGASSTSSLAIPALNTIITSYPFTVEMWVKPTTYVSYGGFWVDRSGSINSVQYDNNPLAYLRSDFNGNARFITSLTNAKPIAGTWNHISMIVRADSVIVELNGTYYKSLNTATSWNSSFFSNISYIGSDPGAAGRNVAGLFDEVRFWNTVRTPAQIEASKSTTLTGNEAGLVAYYNFDAQNANDRTTNAKNATVYGGTYTFIPSTANDATLSAINLSCGVLDKDFVSATTNYSAYVPPTCATAIVTGVKSQMGANLNNSPAEISASNPAVTMVCTSSDGTATKNYTINYLKTNIDDWDANGTTGNRSYSNLWGWNCSNTTTCWSLANSAGTACRYNDVTTGWTYNGAAWTGRNLYIRWDGSGATNTSSVFSYPLYLEACQTYTLKFKYAWANNATIPTWTTTIANDINGSAPLVTADFICSSTKQLLQEGSLTFSPSKNGVYYFTVKANTAALCAIADISMSKVVSPSLTTSVSTLSFDDINKVRTFVINGNSLNDSVKLSAPAGIMLNKYGFSAPEVQCGVVVTATFDNLTQIVNQPITVSSGSLFNQIILVSGVSGDVSCYTPLYADKVNLMIDPFINNISNLTGWGTFGVDANPGVPFCGTSCGKITTSGSLDYNLTLKPYTKYKMRVMVKSVGGTFQLGVAKYDGSSADIVKIFDTQGAWTSVELNFNTGANVAGALTFFNNYQKTGTTGYIDNWELYEVGTVEGSTANISLEQFSEVEVKTTLREMLAKHLSYSESQYKTAGYFGNGQSVEHGARTNADYALVYSFIYKKAQDQSLPNGLSFETVKSHALAAIRYSYKTHTANKVTLCTDSKYWGLVWESAMWSTSTAYAAWLMWDDLTEADKAAIKTMVLAEANYKLSTPIPTAVNSDTKAEENGWDTNILAIASAMFHEEKNAEAWTYRCKQYAMNTYSVASDIYNYNVVDGKYVRDWHIGANLFPDYALENHNFFHTSYLNIPIQEMSESLLAYKAVQNQTTPVFQIPQALKHNVSNVWNSMLKEFILPDGILAMPNGNDWSMYIYDELGTYSALAAIYRDPDALMLESMVLQWAKIRQATTSDGSFLLNPDVGERRMAVTARRLVFAHLYHDYFSTNNMTATKWRDFSAKHETTRYLPYSGIIRGNNKDRYTTFSWFQSADASYKSYMGMVSPNSPNYSNIVFPFKIANGGNFTGYTDVSGYTRNASYVSSTFGMYPKSFVTTGRLSVTGGSMNKYLSFYSTPGNAVIYHENMVGAVAGTITKDGGLMLGITTDVLTKVSRTLYGESGNVTSTGDAVSALSGNWVNVDNVLGMVVNGGSGIAFGEKELSTSVYVSKLYGSYTTSSKTFAAGETVNSRSAIIYSGIDAPTTKAIAAKAKYPFVATGWKATAAEDPDGKRYLLMSNFQSAESSEVSLSYPEGAPVFDRVTTISGTSGTATFNNMMNSSTVNELYTFINAGIATLKAVQGDNPYAVYLKNENASDVSANVSMWLNGSYQALNTIIPTNNCKLIQVTNNVINSETAVFPDSYRNISRGKHVIADDQWPENFPFATIDEIDSTYYKSLTLPTASTPKILTIRLWSLNACNKLNLKSVAGIGPKDIQLQISNDGSIFTTVSTTTLNDTSEWQTINFPESDARYFRIRITSSYGTQLVGVNEIQLFGYPK